MKNEDKCSLISFVANRQYDRVGDFDFSDKPRFADFNELEKYLEDIFIPGNILCKRKYDDIFDENNMYLSIALTRILLLNCCEDEFKYIMNYLNDRNIHVHGLYYTLSSDFSNYDNAIDGPILSLPNVMEYSYQKELFMDYSLYKGTKRGYEIRNKIVEGNMRLVPFVTYKYTYITNYSIDELNSFGYEGLIFAVENFDMNLGYKFSTYAITCIRNYVRRAITEMNGFTKDSKFYRIFVDCKRIVESLYSEKMGKKVLALTSPEIIDDIMDIMKAEYYVKDGKVFEKNRNRIYDIYHYSYEQLLDLEYYFDMDDKLLVEPLKEVISELLGTLTYREKEVLIYRYGLDGQQALSLEEMGAIYGVSKQGISSIERNAIKKLRKPDSIKKLINF